MSFLVQKLQNPLGWGIILLVLFVSGCNLPFLSSGNSSKTTNSSKNEEVLESLGFTIETGEPKDDFGRSMGNRNPLGKNNLSIKPNYEICLLGASLSSVKPVGLYLEDPTASEITTVAIRDNESWMNRPKKSVSTDMDGDGIDEMLTAILFLEGDGNHKIQLRVWDSQGLEKYSSLTFDAQGALDLMYNQGVSHVKFHYRDLTAGDFDNDGNFEAVLSVHNHIYLIDLQDGSIKSTLVFNESQLTGPNLRVEAGDLNGDSFCDLVIMDGVVPGTEGYFYIFSGGENGLGLAASSSLASSYEYRGKLEGFSSAEPVIADIDGDKLNEIIFGGIDEFDRGLLCYSVVDPFREDILTGEGTFFSEYIVAKTSLSSPNDISGALFAGNYQIPRVVAGDFNGDGKSEFGIMDYFFTYNSESSAIESFVEGQFGNLSIDTARHHSMFHDVAAAGDVTGDGIDDLVFLEAKNLSWFQTIYYHGNMNCEFGDLVVWGYSEADAGIAELSRISTFANQTYPTLTLGNIDSDSLVLEFDRRELHYAEPKILTLLASPPYNEYMEIGNSRTSYEALEGTSNSYSHSWGATVGATIGYSAEISMPAFDIISYGGGESLSVEASGAWGFQKSFSNSTSYECSAEAGNDTVIVAAIPIDVYVYNVLSTPADSLAEDILTVCIPRELKELHMDVALYNQRVDEKDRISAELLHHRIGDPNSYYHKSDIIDIMNIENQTGLFYTGSPKTVTQGMGTTSLKLAREWGTDFITNEDVSLTYERTQRILLVDSSISAGVNYSYSLEDGSFEGFSVTGEVGALPLSNTSIPGAEFGWGMAYFPVSFDGQSFNIVTYWVD